MSGGVPDDFLIQVQTGMLVTERPWLDFISYSGGLPMYVTRIEADPVVQDAIVAAATDFEAKLSAAQAEYDHALVSMKVLIPTERRIEQEMFV